jgi:hypothetical protein
MSSTGPVGPVSPARRRLVDDMTMRRFVAALPVADISTLHDLRSPAFQRPVKAFGRKALAPQAPPRLLRLLARAPLEGDPE